MIGTRPSDGRTGLWLVQDAPVFVAGTEDAIDVAFSRDGATLAVIRSNGADPPFGMELVTLAAGGSAAFYTGPLAQAMVDKVRNHPTNPGRLSMADLAAYQSKEREAVCGTYRIKYRVCGMPMPSSGGTTVAMILGILDQFDVASLKANMFAAGIKNEFSPPITWVS